MVVDSACDLTVVSSQAAVKLGLEVIPERKLFAPVGGATLESPGYVNIECFMVGDRTLRGLRIPVCDVDSVCAPAIGLLGLDLFPDLGFEIKGVPHTYPDARTRVNEHDDEIAAMHQLKEDWMNDYALSSEQREKLLENIEEELSANRAIPTNSFCSLPGAVVQLYTGKERPVYTPQYRVSDYMSGHIDAQVAAWDLAGVTVPAPAYSPWNSPIIGVQSRADKRKGKEPRVCIDPRPLNAKLPSDPRPIPTVDEVHRLLGNFKFITEIDLRKSFNQIRVCEQDQIKTTFTWKGKKRMFAGAPFGLKPLSQIFQSIMENLLEGARDYAHPFVDNIDLCL